MQIARGAEAVITKDGNAVTKERISKGYRLKEIDEKLRKRRTSMEARLLREARRSGVATPQILEEDKFSLKMAFIDGKKIKDILNKSNCNKICAEIGASVAKLHTYDIIHGDLTTSNMILVKDDTNDNQRIPPISICLIDFGLGFISKREEDKAIDLHVLRETLESTHFDVLEEAWTAIMAAYKKHCEGGGKVIKALLSVEKRGRYVKDR